MEKCYKSGSCGFYENRACNECPASKPEYMLKEKHIDIFVATLEGNVKDNYTAIGFTEEAATANVLFAFFKDYKHSVADLTDYGMYVFVKSFTNGCLISID